MHRQPREQTRKRPKHERPLKGFPFFFGRSAVPLDSLKHLAGQKGVPDDVRRAVVTSLHWTQSILGVSYEELTRKSWTIGKRDRAFLNFLEQSSDRDFSTAISNVERKLLRPRDRNRSIVEHQDMLLLAAVGAIRRVFGERCVTRHRLLGDVLPSLLQHTRIGQDIQWSVDAIRTRIDRRGGSDAVQLASVFPLSIDPLLKEYRPDIVFAEPDHGSSVPREIGKEMFPVLYIWLRKDAPRRFPNGLRPIKPGDPLTEEWLSLWQAWVIRRRTAPPHGPFATVVHAMESAEINPLR